MVPWMVLQVCKGITVTGLIITFVNLAGGTIMGILRGGMTFQEAIEHYGVLTIGDGLSSQIPSLLISLATGILVTKASKKRIFQYPCQSVILVFKKYFIL